LYVRFAKAGKYLYGIFVFNTDWVDAYRKIIEWKERCAVLIRKWTMLDVINSKNLPKFVEARTNLINKIKIEK
jgi:hypothetical protein